MRNRPLISHGMGTTIEGTPGALDDLTDVDAPSPTDGQALIWDSGAGEWVAGDAASALTVEDGTTSVTPVDTIVFDGATVTDDTGGQVTVEITGGGSSGPNLELDYVQITSDVTVSGTAETSAGSTLVVTGSAVTYDGATTVILEFFAPGVANPALTSGNDVRLGLYEGSTLHRAAGADADGRHGRHTTDNKPLRALYRFTPSAGSHTYAIRAQPNKRGRAIIRAGAGGADELRARLHPHHPRERRRCARHATGGTGRYQRGHVYRPQHMDVHRLRRDGSLRHRRLPRQLDQQHPHDDPGGAWRALSHAVGRSASRRTPRANEPLRIYLNNGHPDRRRGDDGCDDGGGALPH